MSLYTPQVLGLAAELADYPLTGAFAHRATVRSRTCGSVMDIGLDCNLQGAVSRVGMKLAACAMGQASAAIMAAGLIGRDPAAIIAARASLERFQQAMREAGDTREVTTEITTAKPFYYAEDDHQQYLHKNPYGDCGIGGIGVCLPPQLA